MKVLLGEGVTDPHGEAIEASWEEFCALAHKMSIAKSDESDATKRAGHWFSAAAYKGNHRRRENLEGKCWAVVADLDHVKNVSATEKHLARWEYLAWTTFNSTPKNPRWRVVIPIEGGCSIHDFQLVAEKVLTGLDRYAKIDPRSYLPEQLWFWPEFKRSQTANHQVWRNSGSWVKAGRLIEVDFTGVKLASKPGEIGEGDRNNALVRRLNMLDALRSESRDELSAIALEWNSQLKSPMSRKEVQDVVRKTWNWMQRGSGVTKRAEAWRAAKGEIDIGNVGTDLGDDSITSARMPDSIVGDFLYPGATMISAKMKEGKSFLAMQLALSVSTGTPFLVNQDHPGFAVRTRKKVCILALEDTRAGINHRFSGNLASGHLPTPDEGWVTLVFSEDLENLRKKSSGAIDGLILFEALVQRWYNQGVRLIAIDPLRVLEATLGIQDYPGSFNGSNIHARDFQTMRYFTNLAQQYDDLYFLISMHHGKSKLGQNQSDPGDLIAGSTGFGAGAIATLSLLAIPSALESDDHDEDGAATKRRELYIHGRYTREQRILIEQHKKTGVWQAKGNVRDQLMTTNRATYFEAMIDLGGENAWLTSEAIARAAGVKPLAVKTMLNRAMFEGSVHKGFRVISKRGPGGGYKLTR